MVEHRSEGSGSVLLGTMWPQMLRTRMGLLDRQVCISIYLSMYVCTYVCTYVCMYVHMYVCIGAVGQTGLYMYVCMYVCMYNTYIYNPD
jgi:hypothetical protein